MNLADRFKQYNALSIQDWRTLNELKQLDAIVIESKDKPVVIFKHSTRCGISFGAKARLESEWNFEGKELAFYYLDLLQYRPISNEIATRFGVHHQSPQIIVLKEGKAVHTSSHHAISGNNLKSALQNI